MVRRRSRRRSRQGPVGALPQSRYPLDRTATWVMMVLALVLGLLVFSGNHATARVRDFSWQDRQVGVEDRAFLITFTRPMDPVSVEANLAIDPPLEGKVSWAGRRMAYTLTDPVPYGQSFAVQISDARDRFARNNGQSSQFQPFEGHFQTRQRAFVYIGVEGDEANRLVLAKLDQQERTILTPRNLSVMNFQPYPLGDKILFSATDLSETDGLLNQQIYTVTTGLIPNPPLDLMAEPPPFWQRWWPQLAAAAESGQVELVLDNRDYQNLRFDLSADGKTIVVQRVNQANPGDFGPWVVRQGKAPYRLDTDPGGDFLIAPDSQSLVILQGEGTAILDLESDNATGPRQPLDFLPNYGRVFDIAADGSTAAMVNFNQNDPAKRFTESLFLVTNQGLEEELIRVSGSILDAQFDPTKRFLYVLASEQLDQSEAASALGTTMGYSEQPLLLAIDIQDMTLTKLLMLPQQPRIHMSLSPDGRSLLLDLDGGNAALPGRDEGPSLWYLPLFESPDQATPEIVDPERFPFQGIQAVWLP